MVVSPQTHQSLPATGSPRSGPILLSLAEAGASHACVQLAPPSLVRQVAEAIPAGEFVEIEGAGHAAHHERGEWLASVIVSWLTER